MTKKTTTEYFCDICKNKIDEKIAEQHKDIQILFSENRVNKDEASKFFQHLCDKCYRTLYSKYVETIKSFEK